MTETSDVKLDMDFVIVSKLSSTFKIVFLVGVLHSLFISGAVGKYHIIFNFVLTFTE